MSPTATTKSQSSHDSDAAALRGGAGEHQGSAMENGWQTKKLGDLCEIELGKTPARANKAFWDEKRETSNVWLSIADLLTAEDNVVVDSKEYLSHKGAAVSKTVRKGTLLASFKLTLGRLAFAGRDLFTNEAIAALSIFNERELSKEFLFYFLHFFDWRKAAENDVKLKGMTLNKAKLKELHVHFPSPAQQQRIVGILDEAFGGIATAKANAEKNVQNASDIYASVLEHFFQRSVGDCEMVEFSELIHTLTDYHANGSYEVLKQNVELKDTENFAWMVRSTDFENDFQNEMRYITKAAYDFLTKSRVFGGEIIMSKIGNAGKVYLMPEITTPCSLAMNLFLIRLNENKASNKYVYRYLKSKRGEAQILTKLKGVATQTITKESVRSLRIPLLPRNVQDRFVAKLENMEAETQRLESTYQRKVVALEALKKSLLHQAFSGQL